MCPWCRPLRRIYDQRSLAQRHSAQPAGNGDDILARQHVRTQVNVARCYSRLDVRGARRERECRLGDVIFGMSAQAHRKFLAFGPGGCGSDQHAVAAGAMNLLYHQLLEMRQRVFELLALAAHVRRNIRQDRLLTEVKINHVRNVRVDRLVVCNASADRIRQRDLAGPIYGQQSGHAQRRVWSERTRIEKIVIDAAIDDVDPLRTARGAHKDVVVLHKQILPFDQFDTHLLRQKCVLEIGRVVHTGRQKHDGGVVDAKRGHRAKILEQNVRIMRDWRHSVPRK